MRQWLRASYSISIANVSGKRAFVAAPLLGRLGSKRSFAGSDESANASSDNAVVSLMTWNILARPYTKYNAKHHRASKKVEDVAQTRSRYTLAGNIIVSRSLDLVLLQECEAEFFDPEWNTAAAKIIEGYDIFSCRQQQRRNKLVKEHPGTAVLVKKGGRAVPKVDMPICIGGSSDTGGASKIATVVPVRVASRDVSVVSLHLTHDGMAEKRSNHLRILGEQLTEQSVVLGGDFNCQPGPGLDALASSCFLGELQRAALHPGEMTGLSGDLVKALCIDHVYIPASATVLKAVSVAWPSSPWSGKDVQPAQVVAASDHVPLIVELALS